MLFSRARRAVAAFAEGLPYHFACPQASIVPRISPASSTEYRADFPAFLASTNRVSSVPPSLRKPANDRGPVQPAPFCNLPDSEPLQVRLRLVLLGDVMEKRKLDPRLQDSSADHLHSAGGLCEALALGRLIRDAVCEHGGMIYGAKSPGNVGFDDPEEVHGHPSENAARGGPWCDPQEARRIFAPPISRFLLFTLACSPSLNDQSFRIVRQSTPPRSNRTQR